MKIKKLFFVLVLMIFSACLVACNESTDVTKLEEAVSGLENDKLMLEDEISLLWEQIEQLEKTSKNQTSIITALREKVFAAEAELEKLNEIIGAMNNGVYVQLAEKYQLVVGDNFQLFYRSVVRVVDPYGYYIKLEGTVGHQYNRYYEFKPDKIGEYALTLSVCDSNGNVLGSDSTTLVVNSNVVSNNTSKNILCIGDSLTANGEWVSQGIKKYKAAGYSNVNTIGTVKKTPSSTNTTVRYEGYAGWQWSSYVKGYNATTASPFKSTSDPDGFSFTEYCSKNGFARIDEVYILLTWNGIGGFHNFREFNFEDGLFSYAKQFIDKLHEQYPNAKISLMSIPLPSVNSGLGDYYEIDSSYGDNYAQLCTAMNYNMFVEQWCLMDEYSSFMRYIDVMGQFDSEYNMPTVGKPVNNQNNTQEQIGSSMGMHPTSNGYLQIGDTFFRALMQSW